MGLTGSPKSEKVPFQKERQMIERLIALEQMRLSLETNMIIEIGEETEAVQIPPLLLLPLVENVFKHGDLSDAEYPCRIESTFDEQDFNFKISNKIKANARKDKSSGIGLVNIKKRLWYFYGERAALHIDSQANIFSVNLKLSKP